jgi:hypothetical protein
VIDNPQATAVGQWTTNLVSNRYGTDSLSKLQGLGDAYVAFQGTVPKAGNYSVYEWHASVANRSQYVPCLVEYATGSALLNINQTLSSGVWRNIGTFPFSPTVSAQVKLFDNFPDMGRTVVADAIRLVYVPDPPLIFGPPQNQTVRVGASVSFVVNVSGVQPFSFQWRKNGINIGGETNRMLNLNSVRQEDGGLFTVLVTSSDGMAVSQPAKLTVAPLWISRLPTAHLVLEWNGQATLQSATNVLGPFSDVPGATTPCTNLVAPEPQRYFRLKY